LKLSFVYLVCFVVSQTSALELQFAGVIGNSGDITTTIGRTGGGVVVDAQGRIFCGGGDRILVLSRDGRRLWDYALPQPDWVLGGPGFAVVGDQLFFIAGKPDDHPTESWEFRPGPRAVVPNVCRVRMLPESPVEVVVGTDKLAWTSPYESGWLTLSARGDDLFLGYRPAGKPYTVAQIAPDGALTPLFEHDAASMSVDEEGSFYLGSGDRVAKVDRHGQPVPGFTPSRPPYLGAVPSMLQGQVMLTRGALWDGGPYGFIARFDRQYRSAPGVVVQNQLLLNRINQVCDVPAELGPDQYYLQSHDAVYLAALVDGQLRLRRRFGSLPEVNALVVTRQGYVGVGNVRCATMWYDFEKDDPTAAPLKAYWPPDGQGWYDGQMAMMAYMFPSGRIGLERYRAEPFIDFEDFDRHFRPSDLRLAAAARVGSFIFALERSQPTLWRATANEPTQLAKVGQTTAWLSTAATSLTALGVDTLALAGGGKIVALKVGKDGSLTRLWELSGDGRESFGQALYVGASASLLLVADTDHDRVLLFRLEPTGAALVAQCNNGLRHPTLVALEGARAAVCDSGNQRVVKLRIK